VQILCRFCRTWFPFDSPNGFFPHLVEAHPWSVEARAVAAVAVRSQRSRDAGRSARRSDASVSVADAEATARPD
jgi:hypothetical protein